MCTSSSDLFVVVVITGGNIGKDQITVSVSNDDELPNGQLSIHGKLPEVKSYGITLLDLIPSGFFEINVQLPNR